MTKGYLASLTPRQRSEHMALIRGRDTEPEMLVRAFLKTAKVRFETHAEDLPGTPDIVVRSAKVAVFVHGCFWHRHGCRRTTKPKANVEYWEKKFSTNIARDRKAERALRADGWRVIVAWECKTRSKALRALLLRLVAPHLRLCHDCSEIALTDYRHCAICRVRYARGFRMPKDPIVREKRGAADTPKRRKRRIRLKLCTECGMPALDGRKTCPEHSKKKSTHNGTRWFHRLAEKGLCRCKAPLAPGHKRCKKCLRALRREAHARYQRYKEQKRCLSCPLPRYRNTSWCKKHRAKMLALQPRYMKAFFARRAANKRCVICNRKTKGTLRCARCTREDAAAQRARYRTRVDKNKCGHCGKPATPGYSSCARCRKRNTRKKARQSA